MMTTTAIKTTMFIEYTQAATIRCVAKQAMPDYGLLEGQLFYLIRSSKNDGTYYVATWDYSKMQWSCRCPSRKPCRHEKLVNADCKKLHVLQSYKPLCKAQCKPSIIVEIPSFGEIPGDQGFDMKREQEKINAFLAQARQAKIVKSWQNVPLGNNGKAFSLMR